MSTATAKKAATLKIATPKVTASKTPKAAKRLLAIGANTVGGIGVFAMGLSVIHCTQSIAILTGSGTFLAGLLAVTIDAGMIACEIADLLAHGTEAANRVKPWATAYIVMTVMISMFLNAYGSALHAPVGMRVGSYVLGALIPVLVFILGKVAGHLWIASR